MRRAKGALSSALISHSEINRSKGFSTSIFKSKRSRSVGFRGSW